MVARKSLALAVLAWGALTSSAGADAMTWANSIWGQSRVWVYGQGAGAGTNSGSVVSNAAAIAPAQAAPASPAAPSPANVTPAPGGAPPAATPVAAPPIASAPVTPAGPVNAFINLGSGPYPEQQSITTGNAQPWFNSSQVVNLFGGQPTAQQQQDFDNAIIQRVQQTFQLSGVPMTLTDNPNVPAGHTLSVVSNTSSAAFPGAIGTTDLGSNGFTFIDPIAQPARSVDQLEWIVAHNVSHELMLAFGVGEHYDQTGNYIDATNANWSMITSPTATFSPAASEALLSQIGATGTAATSQPGAQMLNPPPVPEPATVALWVAALSAVVVFRRTKACAKS